MSGQDGAAKGRKQTDRWGLAPVRPGVLRGMAINIRHSEYEGPFGPIAVVDFDLHLSKDQPTVPVRMEGNDFTGRLIHGMITDVADPAPAQRPILTTRLVFPQIDGQMPEMLAHFPGRGGRAKGRDRSLAVLMIIGPAAAGLVLGLLIIWYFHKF